MPLRPVTESNIWPVITGTLIAVPYLTSLAFALWMAWGDR